jgi:hypothetical protein
MTVLRPSSHREQQRLDQIVAVVPQRDLGAAHSGGRAVEDAAAQPRADGAAGPTLGRQPLHHRVRVFPEHAHFASLRAQVFLELPGREPWMALVEVAGDEVEADLGPLAQALQQVEQGERVLAPGDPDQDAVSLLDQPELVDGAAHLVQEALLELAVGRRLSHAGPLVTPTVWPGSTSG